MEQTTAKPIVQIINNTYQLWHNGNWRKLTNFIFKRTGRANVYKMLNENNRESKPVVFGGLELLCDRKFSLKCASAGPFFFYGSKSELRIVLNYFLNEKKQGVSCG